MSCQQIRMDDTFPASVREDLGVVANSLRQVMDGIFCYKSPPLGLPIVCLLGKDNPVTSLDCWSAPTKIRIYVSVPDRCYDKFAFQLAHELGHVYVGVYRDNGAIETIATAVSLEALSRLTPQWEREPPFRNWIDYAPKFQEYGMNERQRRIAQCPAEIREAATAGRWDVVKQRIGPFLWPMDTSMERLFSEEARALRTVAALALLSQKVVWPEFISIENCTALSPDLNRSFQLSPFDCELIRARAPSILWIVKGLRERYL